MPHVEIKCYPGRTDEQKKRCADGIAEVVADTLGCKVSGRRMERKGLGCGYCSK
jgi:phenylpyruvate tautomerase PptA (4-oxalocrotonate tautomerase family)